MKKKILGLVIFMAIGMSCSSTVQCEEWKEPQASQVFRDTWRTLMFRERDAVAYPEKAIKLMGIKKGDVIVDINPGPGYWTFKLAKAAGPSGRVVGLQVCEFDCDEMDAWVEVALSDRLLNPHGNVKFIKDRGNKILPDNSVDLILVSLCAVMLRDANATDPTGAAFSRTPAFAAQEKILRDIYRMLKPGGRLVVIDILDTDAIGELAGKNDADKMELFNTTAERVEDVVKNYESRGFRKTAEYPIYRGRRHADDVKKTQRSKKLKELVWQAKVTFACEQFFLVFEKPGTDKILTK